MSDQNSNSNTAGPSTGSSCQNRKRDLELEIPPDPAPEVQPEVAEGKDSSDRDGGGGRRVKPKLELESDPPVDDNLETEEDARKKKSAELKLKVMKNTGVMGKTAEKLSVKNLLDLRQTCPRWNQSFVPLIKKFHKEVHFQSWQVDGKIRDTDEFMELIRSSQDFPFARYRFRPDPPDDIENSWSHDSVNFSELIYEFGNTITSFTASWKGRTYAPVVQLLKLRRIIFHSRMPELTKLVLELEPCFVDWNNHVHKFGRELATSLPNLKRFTVTHVPLRDGSHEVHPEVCQLVSDVIQWANGLKFLKIQDRTPNNKIVQAALAGFYLRNSEHPCKTFEVSHLNIGDLQKLIELARRQKNALQLNSFATDVKCLWEPANEQKTEAIQLLHDFLVTHSKTLEKLSLTFKSGHLDGDDDELLCIRIPRMERVEYLRIGPEVESRKARIGYQGQEGLNALLSAFPALRQFQLGCCSDFRDCTELTSHPEVEEFTVSGFSVGLIGFTRFGIIFPSLTRLELKLNDWTGGSRHVEDNRYNISELATIWRAWPSLTVVKMIGKFNGPNLDFDSFLSGVVPHWNLECMRNDYFTLAASSNLTLSSLRGILAKYKTMPGISDLKQLRELTINIRNFRNDAKGRGQTQRLTNLGGYFGVALASSQIQRISVHGQQPNQISEECQAFLRNTFGPCAVIDL